MKTIMLPVVLHGCETWSLTLRKDWRLRVLEENSWAYEGRGNRGVEKTT
jgi:hypothetical protein